MSKKISNSVMIVFGCMVSLPMIAMISKPKHTQEEELYTQQEQDKQKRLGPQLLQACFDRKLQQVSRLLNDGADPNSIYAEDEKGITPLLMAVYKGSLDIVKLLVEHGADMVEANNIKNLMPLFLACALKETNIVEYMLEKGANPNAIGSKGVTLLATACHSDYPEIVKLLLSKGADINLKDTQGATALHLTCNNKTPQIMNILIAQGADINAQDSEGYTPLHYACSYKKYNNVHALLKAGADYNISSIEGLTPVEFACDLNFNEVIPLFIYFGAVVRKQEEADKAMHEFFAELKQESSLVKATKDKRNIKKVVVQSQAKKPKKIKQKKEIIAEKEVVEPTSYIIPVETSSQESFEQSTSTASTTASTSTAPTALSELSQKETFVAEEKNVYSVVEGKQLKWPRSLLAKQEKLIEKNIKALMNWPDHGLSDVKKMKDKSGKYRLRVGGYRIIFSVDDITRVITVETIGLRKNIYKKF